MPLTIFDFINDLKNVNKLVAIEKKINLAKKLLKIKWCPYRAPFENNAEVVMS